MTHHLTALTEDRARLIAQEARTTCAETADLIERNWMAQGYRVVRRQED